MRTVIETHADDAYLSLHGLLRRWADAAEPLRIVTVYSGTRKRGADARAYAAQIGAEWEGLGLVEKEDGPGEGMRGLPPEVADWLEGYCIGEEHQTYFPLGLGHPEHRGVAALAPHCARRYVDQPYAQKAKLREELGAELGGRLVEEVHVMGQRDWTEHGLFKDQATFMYYNGPRDLRGLWQVTVS